jgi:hypothetical protein
VWSVDNFLPPIGLFPGLKEPEVSLAFPYVCNVMFFEHFPPLLFPG